MKTQRQLQIGENIKRLMSEIFLRDDFSFMLGNIITVVEADVSPDAKNVKIYIDICGDVTKHQEIITKINNSTNHLRFQLAKKINLRTVPEIVFVQDKTGNKQFQIEDLIIQENDFYNNLNNKNIAIKRETKPQQKSAKPKSLSSNSRIKKT